jgi:hypothetical protein
VGSFIVAREDKKCADLGLLLLSFLPVPMVKATITCKRGNQNKQFDLFYFL